MVEVLLTKLGTEKNLKRNNKQGVILTHKPNIRSGVTITMTMLCLYVLVIWVLENMKKHTDAVTNNYLGESRGFAHFYFCANCYIIAKINELLIFS